ncbi:MAG: hypothetical protein QOJ04_4265, partial [Caballeronia sp.]|nr:hypothetical protein [Caballeronia sp.]
MMHRYGDEFYSQRSGNFLDGFKSGFRAFSQR